MRSKFKHRVECKAAPVEKVVQISREFHLYPESVRGSARSDDGAQFFDAEAMFLTPHISSFWHDEQAGLIFVPASTRAIHDLALFSNVAMRRGEKFFTDTFAGKSVSCINGYCKVARDSIRNEPVGSSRWEELYALAVLLKVNKFNFLKDVIAEQKAATEYTYEKPRFTAENYKTAWKAYPLFPHESLARSVAVAGSTDRMAYCRSGKWVDIYTLQSPATRTTKGVYHGYRIAREEYDKDGHNKEA